jgi:hypothetical protein
MAATGLLGINPYQKGLNLDITSKPANLAIQLAQKEQAKQEAMTKYLLDYDTKITGAGMAQNDIDGLMSLKNQAKKYFFENKKEITNTALDNGKAYSNLMSLYDNAEKLIAASKDKVATTKATGSLIARANNSGEILEPETYKAFEASQLPVNSGYQPFNITNFRTYKPFDALEYQGKLKNAVRLSDADIKIVPLEQLPKQYQYEQKTVKPNLEDVRSIAYGQMGKRGYDVKIEDISNDATELKRLGKIYKAETNNDLPDIAEIRKKINTTTDPLKLSELKQQEKNALGEISVANTLSFIPAEIKKSKAEEIPEYKRKRQAYYSSITKNNAPDAFDFITKGANILNTGNIDLINQHFSKFAVQGDRDIAGNFIGYKDMEIDPKNPKNIIVNYTEKVMSGNKPVAVPVRSSIDLTKDIVPQLASFYQQFLGKNAGLEKAAVANPSSDNKTGKVITTAAFQKMSLSDREKFLTSGGTYK